MAGFSLGEANLLRRAIGSENKLVVNPGSVRAGNNRDLRAQYALLTRESGRVTITLRAVAYDLGRASFFPHRVQASSEPSQVEAVISVFCLDESILCHQLTDYCPVHIGPRQKLVHRILPHRMHRGDAQ